MIKEGSKQFLKESSQIKKDKNPQSNKKMPMIVKYSDIHLQSSNILKIKKKGINDFTSSLKRIIKNQSTTDNRRETLDPSQLMRVSATLL